MKLITLKTEKDFQKLNYLPFNRNFYVRNDLIENMNTYGFVGSITLLKLDILDGVPKIYIIDGQHRCVTAQYLNIPVNGMLYTQEETNIKSLVDLVKFVASMNSSSKIWTTLNYAQVYNFLNYIEYRKLIKVTNSSPYKISTVAPILSGYKSNRGNIANKIKNGTFVCDNYKHALYTLKLASRLSKYEKVTSRMLIALNYVSALKQFNESVFIDNYKSNIKKMKQLKLDDYKDIFSSWSK